MKILIVLLLAVSAIAQTPAPAVASANVAQCPTIIIGTGGGVISNSGQANTAEGWVSGMLHLGGCNYLGTNVDMQVLNGISSNTLRAEYSKLFPFGRLADGSARWLVGPVMSAGTATTPPIIGSFAGGLYVAGNLGAITPKLSGLFLSCEFRITGATQTIATSTVVNGGTTIVTSTTSEPTAAVGQVSAGLYIGLSYTFR